MEQEKYIPGVCNIGPDERRLRKLGGWVGIGLFIALFGILYFTGAPHWARLFLFLPAITAATGWVQYKNHFCVNFGMRGLRNLDKPAFQTENVIEAEYKKKDRQRSLRLIGFSVVMSLAATAIAYFL